MKLRFWVRQGDGRSPAAEAFHSTTTLEVDPAALSPQHRALLADRLQGIDVCRLSSSELGTIKDRDLVGRPVLVEASEATFEGLMTAVNKNQDELEKTRAHLRNLAIATASEAAENPDLLDDPRSQIQGNTTLSW